MHRIRITLHNWAGFKNVRFTSGIGHVGRPYSISAEACSQSYGDPTPLLRWTHEPRTWTQAVCRFSHMYLHFWSITPLPDAVATRATRMRNQRSLSNTYIYELPITDITVKSYCVYMGHQWAPTTPAYFAYHFWTSRHTVKFEVCAHAPGQDLQFDTSVKTERFRL